QNVALRLTRVGGQRQCTRQLAVPRLERVPARTAVTELVAVVAALDDVEHAAGRHRVRIVVHREDPAKDIRADAEGVPEAGSHAAQFPAIGRTPKDMAAIAFSRDGGSVGAFELIGSTEVF